MIWHYSMECVHTNTQETYYYINEATTYISVRHIETLHQEDLTNYHFDIQEKIIQIL